MSETRLGRFFISPLWTLPDRSASVRRADKAGGTILPHPNSGSELNAGSNQAAVRSGLTGPPAASPISGSQGFPWSGGLRPVSGASNPDLPLGRVLLVGR